MEGAADGVLVGRGCYSGTPPIVSQNTVVCVWRAGGITRPAGIRAAGCSIATCVSQATCCCLWDAWGVLLVYLFLHACIQPLPRGTGWPHSWMAVISICFTALSAPTFQQRFHWPWLLQGLVVSWIPIASHGPQWHCHHFLQCCVRARQCGCAQQATAHSRVYFVSCVRDDVVVFGHPGS